MLNIQFDFDEAGLDASAQAYLKEGLTPALVQAVNDTAREVARGLGGFLEDSLHKSTAFTQHAGGYLEARPYDESPAALVFIRRRQAGYLGYEVFGGDKVGGDPGTLPGGVLVPMRDTVLDSTGNPDWQQVDQDLADPTGAVARALTARRPSPRQGLREPPRVPGGPDAWAIRTTSGFDVVWIRIDCATAV